MMTPLISIIIPAYNASNFLLETLESVQKQTYTKWEVILVSDCSTDNTVEIANQFSAKVSNTVKVISNKVNLGVSISRNLAVQNSSGTWLALLDSDDVWLPNHLETLVKSIAKDEFNIKVAYAGCLVFLDNVSNIIFEQVVTDKMLEDFNISLFTQKIGINPCTVIIEKSAYLKAGGMIQEFHHAEDKELLFRLAKNGYKMTYSGKHTALYRKHSNESAASNNSVRMALASVKILEKHYDWDSIPLKIRKEELSNAHLSYARLVKQINLKAAVEHSWKALQVKKSFKNASYFAVFRLISTIR